MFRNIVPKEQSIDSARGMAEDSQLDLSKYQDSESDHSSDEDMEVEVVLTEEIANEKVFRYYNKALLIIMAVIISAVVIELLKPVTLNINNQQYTEMSTIYTTRLDDEQQEITFLMPNIKTADRKVGQAIDAEKCIRHEAQDCWQEVLSAQGFMFVQVEKWVINNNIKGNVLILWEERLALSVLLLALNDQISGRIDVIITPEHNQAYIDGLQVNMQRYQRQMRVNIIKKTVVVLAELRDYHLVIGDQTVFDQTIYTSLLQFSVQRGAQTSFPQLVLEFIAKTNLILFYEAPTSELSKQKLQTIRNQITSIKISDEDYEIMEHAIKDVDQPFNVILLDSRIKDVEKANPEKEKSIEQVPPKPVPQEDRPVLPLVEKMQPLRRLKRIDPQDINNFFKCGTSNRDSAKVGELYQTEIRRIQLIKQAGPSAYLSNTHFYNFILHLLIASEPSNILDWCQDEMLANMAASVHDGYVFIPDSNKNLQKIKVTTYANKLRINQVNNLTPDNFQDFVISNEIKVSCITHQHFISMRRQLETALHSNMNIIMKMEGGEDEQILMESLLQNFHVFVVSVHKKRNYDIKCIKNFEVSYYDGIDYPQNSYLFITKQDVLFQQVDGLDYFEAPISRNFQPTKYPCLRDFTLKEAQIRYNLKKGSRELVIDSKISIFVDGYVDPESVISAIKAQEGINQFLRTVLVVSDKIAVLGQTLQDPYTVANIIWMASGNEYEEVYFFNAPFSFQAYSDKLKQLNRFEAIVEFMDFDWDSEQFQKIFILSDISVVLSTPEIFSKIYKFAEKVRGLLVLLKFEGSSKLLLDILGHFKQKQQYLVSEVEDRANQYNLCLSHDIRRLAFKEMGEETFENGGWIAFTI